MSITQGQNANASDFINQSEADPTPANNEGKVVKLENNGKFSDEFVNLENIYVLVASDDLKVSADTERTETGGTYVKKKEIDIQRRGSIRVKFDLRISSAATAAYGRIYKNGVAVGTERSTTSTSYVTYSEDFDVEPNDLIQLYIYRQGGANTAYCRNFRIYTTTTLVDEIDVVTD